MKIKLVVNWNDKRAKKQDGFHCPVSWALKDSGFECPLVQYDNDGSIKVIS